MPKLKPEIKAEWIRRLRSGDYKQGKGYLHKNGKYCCLGVLCEMAYEAGVVTKDESTDIVREIVRYGADHPATLPREVVEWAGDGITDTGSYGDETLTLAILNDAREYDFNQIADEIEKHF